MTIAAMFATVMSGGTAAPIAIECIALGLAMSTSLDNEKETT